MPLFLSTSLISNLHLRRFCVHCFGPVFPCLAFSCLASLFSLQKEQTPTHPHSHTLKVGRHFTSLITSILAPQIGVTLSETTTIWTHAIDCGHNTDLSFLPGPSHQLKTHVCFCTSTPCSTAQDLKHNCDVLFYGLGVLVLFSYANPGRTQGQGERDKHNSVIFLNAINWWQSIFSARDKQK